MQTQTAPCTRCIPPCCAIPIDRPFLFTICSACATIRAAKECDYEKTIRLGSFLLAFLLLVCTLPVTAWAASTSYDLSRALFRSAETQKCSFLCKRRKGHADLYPQYTAEYTLSFFVHNPNGESGRNAHASLTFPGGKVQEGEYPYRPNAKDYSRPYITATLEKGKTYTYHVWGWLPTSEASDVDITFISGASGALTEELGLRAYLQGKTVFNGYNPQAVLNELKLLVGFKNATQPLEWHYKNRKRCAEH